MMALDSKKCIWKSNLRICIMAQLCRGIGGLARIICFQFQFDSYDKNTLFLFCGKRMDRMNPFIPYVLLRRNTYPRRYTI